MNISAFFQNLRSAYQSELDDLTFDSEGKDVLRQRLADKRKEIGFLVKMMELSPEMVAVVFHRAFSFTHPAVLDHLLSHEADEFPEWESVAGVVQIAPWANDLVQLVLKEPGGEWFMTVAAGLEYMAGKPGRPEISADDDEDTDEDDGDGDSADKDGNGADDDGRDEDGYGDSDSKGRKEAGDDWLANQGFDRKP